ncbi:uncharacterized protein LOC108093377 [Drosophila ficusphila]|uniref:uncharacterized protein LOC108093377 n=1 Tax=Drosophila ficusphila TaxID=30025 RepID=UPI0007E723AC|nr:uncharacterized protein LOC108093377 [Drosophila ficusphila]
MVLMESYFFCASVRQGVLIVSTVAALKSTVLMWVIFTNGTSFIFGMIRIMENHYKTSTIVKESADWVEKYPKELLMFFQLYSFCHIITCIMAAFGAFKLKKYHVIPLAIFEFIYTVQVTVLAIITLRIARHIVPLATLILLTLGLTSYAMLVAYDTLALIAFVQIMFLVWSDRYQRLYGPDPLSPSPTGIPTQGIKQSFPTPQQPIVIYVMPVAGQKLWDTPQEKWWQHDKSNTKIPQKSQQKDFSEFFQRKELMSNVLLRNAINEDYLHKDRAII